MVLTTAVRNCLFGPSVAGCVGAVTDIFGRREGTMTLLDGCQQAGITCHPACWSEVVGHVQQGEFYWVRKRIVPVIAARSLPSNPSRTSMSFASMVG
jgi:hypothetical protein